MVLKLTGMERFQTASIDSSVRVREVAPSLDGKAIRQKAHTAVRKVEAINSAQELISAIKVLDEQIFKVRRDLGLLSSHDLLAGDYRMFPAVFRRLLPIKGTRIRFNAGLVSVRCNEALNEFPGEMWTTFGPDYYRKLIADLKWLLEARESAITKLVARVVHPQGKKFVVSTTALEERRRDLKASRVRRLGYVTEVAHSGLRGNEWYLATLPEFEAREQAQVDAVAAKVDKAKTELAAAKKGVSELNEEFENAENEVVKEVLRQKVDQGNQVILALTNKLANLVKKLNGLKMVQNPFHKDGVKLVDQTGDTMDEWEEKSIPLFEAIVAKRLAESRDADIWAVFREDADAILSAELPNIIAKAEAAKLPAKRVNHIVEEAKQGRLNLLIPSALEDAIAAQGVKTTQEWQTRIPGVNKAIDQVLGLVNRFLDLYAKGMTDDEMVARGKRIASLLEGEGKILETLTEARGVAERWLVNSAGKPLLVPNLPKIVVIFTSDGKDGLSVLSQLRKLAEWDKSPTTVSPTTVSPTPEPFVAGVPVTETTAVVQVETATPEPDNRKLARRRI
jgi:hypothetical protein